MHSQQHQHLLNNYIAFLSQQTVGLLDMCRNHGVCPSLVAAVLDLTCLCVACTELQGRQSVRTS